MDEQTRRKIAYTLRGRNKSATTKKLISQALKNQPKTKQHSHIGSYESTMAKKK